MNRYPILGALAALALTVVAPLSVLAQPVSGIEEPELREDRPPGYYIWHNDDGWHLRTHGRGPGEGHAFTASLHTDGVFASITPVALEWEDSVTIAGGGHTLALRFQTYGQWDGVDFRLRDGADCARFRLELDGELIPVESIYLGAAGRHPDQNPFGMCR